MGSILEVFRFHSYTLIQLLIEPGVFFRSLPEKTTMARVWVFLGCGACFFSVASLLTGTCLTGPPWVTALIVMANAIGVVIIGALIGYGAMVMMFGKKGPFFLVFSIYVFASGMTWLISWLPFMFWFTEPWRWWLTMTGFSLVCGLSRPRALGVVMISAAVQWGFIYSVTLALAG